MKTIFALLLVLLSNTIEAEYVISVDETTSQTKTLELWKSIYTDAYGSLGIGVTFVNLPTYRSFKLIEEGEVDAQMARVTGISDAYPFLIPVPVPVLKVVLNVYCLQPENCTKPGKNLTFSLKGSLLSEKICKSAQLNCQFVNNYEAITHIFYRNANDSILAPPGIMNNLICKTDIKKLYFYSKDEWHASLYHHVHIKHADLIKPLTAFLSTLAENGTLEHLQTESFRLSQTCQVELIKIDQAQLNIN